ncbi:hypothetical protein HY448_00955 [Candidatus Pacearchaeota archaeon]|nr:hypothetical protein [Candidatus Pacearchaeota archaeon]
MVVSQEIKSFSRNILAFLDYENIHYLENLRERLGRKYKFGDDEIRLEESYPEGFDLVYNKQKECPIRIKFNTGFAKIMLRSSGTIEGYPCLSPDCVIRSKKVDSWIYIVKQELEKLCQE